MKNIKILLISLVVILLGTACSEKIAHQNALPKDASLVMAVDLKAMADKSGLSAGEGATVVKKLHDALIQGLDKEGVELLEEVFKDPSASGLSFTDPVYVFVGRQSANVGAVVRVKKQKDVEHTMSVLHKQGICSEIHEAEGFKWAVVGKALLAFSDNAFLTLYSDKASRADDLNYMAAVLLGQDEAGSYAGTDDFKAMIAEKADITISGNMGIVPHEIVSMFSMGLPATLNLEDMKMQAKVNFENGKLVMNVRNTTENKEILAFMKKQQLAFQPLKGTYLDYFAPAVACWMSGNMKGEKAYELLCENPTIRQTLESPLFPVDLYRIFQAIDGEICLALDANNAGFIMYADVKENSFLQTFEDLKPLLALTGGEMQLVTVGPDAYEFRGAYGMMRYVGMNRLWLGVKNNRFYLTNRQEAIDARPLGQNLHSLPWAESVKGKQFFMYMSFSSLASLLSGIPTAEMRTMVTIFNALDKLTVVSSDWQHTEVVLTSKETEKNLLRQVLEGIQNF